MLYELAYPFLYVSAKTQQLSKRTRARMGLAPKEMKRITYKPETCYRLICWRLRKLDIELLMRLYPAQAARLAVKRFERTKRGQRSHIEEADAVTVGRIRYRRRRVHVLYYGPEDGPKVLALHGWNGRAAMLHKLSQALAREGFRVIAPDLPGHGSSQGNRYSFYDLGKATKEIFDGGGPYRAVIGHSGGGLIAAIALAEGLRAESYIPIGAPASLHSLLKSYVDITQMPPAAMEYIAKYYDKTYSIPISAVGPELISRLPVRTLVVHDKRDWMVGAENAHTLAAAARDGELMLTTGCTHLSIIDAQPVHERLVSFMNGGRVGHA